MTDPCPRCADCRFWGTGKTLSGEDLTYSKHWGTAGCARIQCQGDPAKNEPPAYLEAIGYEWEDAVLWTSPDFGCSLWEKK